VARVKPWLVAHRGAMAEAPENTRAAFDRALSYPVDGIEFDVQSSSDGVPVIYHDDTLKKITGRFRALADYPFEHLAAMDWGRWFSPAHAGERLMTLENVLKSYGTRTRLMVEIKAPLRKKHQALYQKLAQTVAEMMRELIPADMQEKMYVLSFDPELLAIVGKHDPGRHCVLNLRQAVDRASEWGIDMGALHGAGLRLSRLNRLFVNFCRSHGKIVMTYSCNTRKTINRALDLGVDVMMTDDPGGIYDYVRKSVEDPSH
jgi:glycerophosphoryl diester phosphodiesterase